MKNVKLLAVIAAFVMISGLTFASGSTTFKKPENVQIQSYLKTVDFAEYLETETRIKITFMVNHENEIIVFATSNPELDNVVKSSLNYKKINMSELQYNVLYTLPVVIM